MIKVTYLYHSGYAVELDRYVLIFDYYKGSLPSVPKEKELFVFISHKHQDHFQLSVLDWAEKESKNAHYFVGNDVRLNEKYLERKGICPDLLQRMERMPGGALYENPRDNLKVETLRSTDQGVAFLVMARDVSIYHGGDLNYWYWPGETAAWNDQMEKDYKGEIDRIAGRHFDLAFLPLDPRLGEGYGLGMDYFLQKVDVGKVFPMHMWDEYDVIRRYKQTKNGQGYCDRIVEVSEENREFWCS